MLDKTRALGIIHAGFDEGDHPELEADQCCLIHQVRDTSARIFFVDQTNGYPANERERILQVELEAANFLREFVGIILCAKDPWHTYLSNGLSQRKPFKQEMQDMLTREHPRSGWAFDFFDQEFPGWCSVAASSTDARDYRDQIFEKFQNHVHRLVIYLMIRHKEKSGEQFLSTEKFGPERPKNPLRRSRLEHFAIQMLGTQRVRQIFMDNGEFSLEDEIKTAKENQNTHITYEENPGAYFGNYTHRFWTLQEQLAQAKLQHRHQNIVEENNFPRHGKTFLIGEFTDECVNAFGNLASKRYGVPRDNIGILTDLTLNSPSKRR